MQNSALLGLLSLAFLGLAPAAERYEIQHCGGCARMGPLSGEGSTEIHAAHDDRIYIFASEGCREGFPAAPERLLERPDPVPEDVIDLPDGIFSLDER